MQKLRNTIIALGLIAIAAPALAADPPGLAQRDLVGSGTIALNGNAAARTITLTSKLAGYTRLQIFFIYTWANNGAITTTCTVGPGSSTAYTPTTCTESSGTCTLNYGGVFVSPSLTASKSFTGVDLGVGGAIGSAACVLAHGGTPSASDTVAWVAWAVRE